MKIFIIVLSALLILSAHAIGATIFEAINDNDLEQVKLIIQENPEVLSYRNEIYCDPLNEAARLGNPEMIKYILSQGADINSTDREGSNALHNAASSGDLESVKFLMESGLDVNTADDNQNTALQFASGSNNIELIRYLIDHGANVEVESANGSTPMLASIYSGNLEIAKLLFENGISINHTNRWGVTPLMYASITGNRDILEYLIDNGADVHAISQNGETALVWATIRLHFDVAELLMEKGLNYNDKDELGRTMFFAAGKSPIEAVEYMIEHGADPLAVDSMGVTPLHIAAQRGNTEIASYLIDLGVDVNKIDDNGWTPLTWTLWTDSLSTMELLLENGAQIENCSVECETGCATNNSSPLHLAASRGKTEFAQALVEHGADINIKNEELKQTPLHLAAALGYGDIAEILIESGCDTDVKDFIGKTAFDLALEHGNIEIAKLLSPDNTPMTSPVSDLLHAPLQEGEIYIWYVTHSGWIAKTRNHLLVFDYWRMNREPDQPTIENGILNFDEISDLDVVVFVSHVHQDHYSPEIFTWNDSLPNVAYVMGFDPHVPDEEYMVLEPRTIVDVNGVEVTTIYSNDTGVGFMVETDGVTILHPGDHANRQRDFSGDYLDEIYYLQDLHKPIDIAFMPITGCNFGDNEAVRLGVHKTFEILEPAIFFPMHGGAYSANYMEFVEQAYEDGATPSLYYQIFPGDRFYFNTAYIQ